jgi:hypothetical protein
MTYRGLPNSGLLRAKIGQVKVTNCQLLYEMAPLL